MAQERGILKTIGLGALAGIGGTTLAAVDEERQRRDLLDITKRKAEKEEKAELLQSATGRALDLSGMAGGGVPSSAGGGVLAGMGGGPSAGGLPGGANAFLTERIGTNVDLRAGGGTRPVDIQSSIQGPPPERPSPGVVGAENLQIPSPVDVGMFRARAEGGRKALLAEDFTPEQFDALKKEGLIRETDPGVSGVFELNTASPTVRKAVAQRDTEVARAEAQAFQSQAANVATQAFVDGDFQRAASVWGQAKVASGENPKNVQLEDARLEQAAKLVPAEFRLKMAIFQQNFRQVQAGGKIQSSQVSPDSVGVSFMDNIAKGNDWKTASQKTVADLMRDVQKDSKDYAKATPEERVEFDNRTRVRAGGVFSFADPDVLQLLAPQLGVLYNPADHDTSVMEITEAFMTKFRANPEETEGFIASLWKHVTGRRGSASAESEKEKTQRDFKATMSKIKG